MTPLPFRLAMRVAPSGMRHIHPVAPRGATGVVGRVYRWMEREFGLVAPPLVAHSPDPSLLAAGWVLLRETLLVTTATGRPVKEAVAAGVSTANRCPYCIEVHSAVLGGLAGRSDAEALRGGRLGEIADPALRRVAEWAAGDRSARPPVPDGQEAEAVAVAMVFDYINRMVHVFLGDSPFPEGMPDGARSTALGMLGRVMAPTAGRRVTAGAASDLLPAAELPADLAWARRSPVVADALARATAVIDAAGARVLSPTARAAVRAEIAAGPEGQAPDAGRFDRACAALPGGDRAGARLAMLVAVAPYRVTDADVAAFRAAGADDAAIVAASAWGAYSAARAGVARAAIEEKTLAGAPSED